MDSFLVGSGTLVLVVGVVVDEVAGTGAGVFGGGADGFGGVAGLVPPLVADSFAFVFVVVVVVVDFKLIGICCPRNAPYPGLLELLPLVTFLLGEASGLWPRAAVGAMGTAEIIFWAT